MRKNNRKNYDVNNSMENQEDSEEKNINKKAKKNKKEKKEKKSKVFNILEEIKKEEESNQKQKLLEEVNNTMIKDNKNNTSKVKNYKEKNKEKDKEEQDKDEWEETEKEKEKERKKKKEKERINKKEKEKEKEEEEKKISKQKKEKKKGNNIISDTFNEISNELDEQYTLSIENIFEINKKFNYPKDSPVFYLREDTSNTDLFPSPLSTKEIQDLLKKREIKPFLLKVKLIDIFIMNNYEPFSYFDFNDILSKNWSKNLEYSPLFLNEYYNYFEKNINNYLIERYQNLEITKKANEFSSNSIKKKK